MVVLPKKLERHLIHRLAATPEVERVILFGSRARGDAEERSDIDLAIAAPHATQRQWLDLVFLLEEAETLLMIDVVRLEEAPDALKERILSEGIVLYERAQGHTEP